MRCRSEVFAPPPALSCGLGRSPAAGATILPSAGALGARWTRAATGPLPLTSYRCNQPEAEPQAEQHRPPSWHWQMHMNEHMRKAIVHARAALSDPSLCVEKAWPAWIAHRVVERPPSRSASLCCPNPAKASDRDQSQGKERAGASRVAHLRDQEKTTRHDMSAAFVPPRHGEKRMVRALYRTRCCRSYRLSEATPDQLCATTLPQPCTHHHI